MIDFKKVRTQNDCAKAMRETMSDETLRNGEKTRIMQSLETLSRTIQQALIEEERRGNESKTAIKKVSIEFITPSIEQLNRVQEIDLKLRELEEREGSKNA